MNKLYIYIICFLLINSYSAAQPWTQSAGASIFLLSPISITPSSGDLDYGGVILTPSPFTYIKEPADGKLFIINGSTSKSISITFNPVDINNWVWVSTYGGTNGQISFTPDVDVEGGPTGIASGDTFSLPDVGGVGELRVWVGGSLDVDAAGIQPVGDYTGEFTITVSY